MGRARLVLASVLVSVRAIIVTLIVGVSFGWFWHSSRAERDTFRPPSTDRGFAYTAPAALARLSEVHKAERLSGPAGTLFRAGQLAVAVMFATTAVIGVVMAFRVARPLWVVWACLAAGTALPVLIAVAARAR